MASKQALRRLGILGVPGSCFLLVAFGWLLAYRDANCCLSVVSVTSQSHPDSMGSGQAWQRRSGALVEKIGRWWWKVIFCCCGPSNMLLFNDFNVLFSAWWLILEILINGDEWWFMMWVWLLWKNTTVDWWCHCSSMFEHGMRNREHRWSWAWMSSRKGVIITILGLLYLTIYIYIYIHIWLHKYTPLIILYLNI